MQPHQFMFPPTAGDDSAGLAVDAGYRGDVAPILR